MMDCLGAFTANHVGLKSGYGGDLTDRNSGDANTYNDGECYGWYVSKDVDVSGPVRIDGTRKPLTIIDKDQDFFNAKSLDPEHRYRNVLSDGYLPTLLPEPCNNLFRFKVGFNVPNDKSSGVVLELVRTSDGSPVTYGDCEALLGFGSVGANTMDLSLPVKYQIVQNLDGQNHVHKGMILIRFDQITNCAAIRCRARISENAGFLPEVNLITNPDFGKQLGVVDPKRSSTHVNDITGISVNGVTNCLIEDFDFRDAVTIGDIKGVQVYGESLNVKINNVRCENVQAGKIYGNPIADPFNLSGKIFDYPTTSRPKAYGVHVFEGSQNTIVSDVIAKKFTSPATDQIKATVIEAPRTCVKNIRLIKWTI